MGKTLAIGFAGLFIGACIGVVAGRQFPARHFERFGDSRFLLESTSGRICDPYKDPAKLANPIDYGAANTPEKDANGVPDLNKIFNPPVPFPPPCGR